MSREAHKNLLLFAVAGLIYFGSMISMQNDYDVSPDERRLIELGRKYDSINKDSDKPQLTCYSAFDVYEVYDYELTDANTTLITSHGRVYHASDCR